MSMHAQAETKVASTPPRSASARSTSGFLQRRCACGGAAGVTDECAACRKKRLGLQAKLAVNEPGDIYEQEADRVADEVLARPARSAVTTAPPRIQRLSGSASGHVDAAPASVDRALTSPARPLEPALRLAMEQRFGHDFARVRVHTGANAEQSARDVNAHAYTVGHNIVFGAEQFAPGTIEGRRLIAHELTHVVQQSASGGTALQRQPRGAAAGCGICMTDPGGRVAGDIAHTEVQDAFIAANPDMVAERPVPGIPNSGIDLSYERRRTGEHALFIGEIKPLDDAGQQAAVGRRQVQDYAREMMLSGQYDEVYRMPNAPPTGPLYFFNPMNPAGCPRQTIMVQLTEAGLYQYYCEPPFSQLVRMSACSCRPRDDDQPPGPFVPPVWVRPGDQPGSSDTKGKGGDRPGKGNGQPGKGNGQPGKGNGQPGKGDRTRKPGQRLPGPDRPQPTLTVPPSVGTLIIILGLLALATGWGKIGAAIGAFLRWLGITIGILGGTAAASPSGTSGGAGGGPVTTVPVPVPGSGGTTSPPSRIGGAPRKGAPTEGSAARPAAAKREVVTLDLIENLELSSLSTGMVIPLSVSDLKSKHGVAILQVTKVVKEGSNTTAEFKVLQEQMGGTRTTGGNKSYTVTHPYRREEPPKLVGSVIKVGPDPQWFMTYLENVANQLQTAGQNVEASQVRNELQRLKQLAK